MTPAKKILLGAAVSALVVALSGCAGSDVAPGSLLKPGQIGNLSSAASGTDSVPPRPGSKIPGEQEDGGASLGVDDPSTLTDIEGRKPTPVEKSATLPSSLPLDVFPFSQEGVDDAGERSATSWFIVVKASDKEAASSLLKQFAGDGGFTQVSKETSGDEIAQTLTSDRGLCEVLAFTDGEATDAAMLVNFECSLSAG